MEEIRAEIEHWQSVMPKKVEFSVHTIEDIILLVSDITGIGVDNILKDTKKGEIVFARQLAQSLAFAFSEENHKNWFLQEIADQTGKKNHSTIINSRYVIYDMFRTRFVSYYDSVKRNNWEMIEEAFVMAGCNIETIKVNKYLN